MKTIDVKSLLVGILATTLVLTLTSSKNPETETINFVGSPMGVGIYNKTTKTLYMYRLTGDGSLRDKPAGIFQVAENGSSVTKQE